MHEPTESDMSRESMMSYYHGALSSSFYISSCREAEGPAAKSLEFPSPALLPCQRGNTIRVLDTESRKCFVLDHVIIVSHSDHAYQLRGKLARSTYGVVRLGVVLKRRSELDRSKEYEDTDWEFSDQLVAIKVSSWVRIRQQRKHHFDDPVKEVSAMQLVGDYHPNVLGVIEALKDDSFLYTVMPHCSGGEIFGHIVCEENQSLDEGKARMWFRQLVDGLLHLQLKGVCHRDLSLENIMVDAKGNLVIIDLGMALRVPYTDPSNAGCVTDVSEGTEPRLIVAPDQGGRLMYLAPEVISQQGAFDGFAVDLWAAGVILFVLLVGMAPFKWAHESDTRYAKIAKGELKELLAGHHITLSSDACDLLQNMFWQDPLKRLSLAQILYHPWVTGSNIATTHGIPNHAVVFSEYTGTRYGATVA